MIFHRFILGDLVTNCYLVADETTKNAVLFDAPANADKIIDYLEKEDLTLKLILLTHAHFDHILALGELVNRTGASYMLHEKEECYLTDEKLNLRENYELNLPDNPPERLLSDGDEVCLDSLKVKVIYTPGHTAGGVCYLVDDILISGDTLFSGSIGRFDFPLGDFDTEINSIKNKLLPLADEIKVYPGHGFSTTIGKQRKENPYLI